MAIGVSAKRWLDKVRKGLMLRRMDYVLEERGGEIIALDKNQNVVTIEDSLHKVFEMFEEYKRIYMPMADYYTSRTVVIKKGMKIFGDGVNRTRVLPSRENIYLFYAYDEPEDIIVKGIDFLGENKAFVNLFINEGARNIKVEKCGFSYAKFTNVQIGNAVKAREEQAPTSEHIIFRENVVKGYNGSFDNQCLFVATKDTIIEKNKFMNNENTNALAIYMYHDGVRVKDNYFSNNGKGMYIQSSRNVIVERNIFDETHRLYSGRFMTLYNIENVYVERNIFKMKWGSDGIAIHLVDWNVDLVDGTNPVWIDDTKNVFIRENVFDSMTHAIVWGNQDAYTKFKHDGIYIEKNIFRTLRHPIFLNLASYMSDAQIGVGEIYIRENIIEPGDWFGDFGAITIRAPDGKAYWIKKVVVENNKINPSRVWMDVSNAIDIHNVEFAIIRNNDVTGAGINAPAIEVVNVDKVIMEKNIGYETEAEGIAEFVGDGATTQFKIEHGLPVEPTKYFVIPLTGSAFGFSSVDKDENHIYVNFDTAPASGATLKYYWYAKAY